MRRVRRGVGVAAGAAAWWLVSCRDVPAPEGGVLSVSPLRLPSPGVVVGDTMRDSTGLVAPLSVVAYGVGGDTIRNAPTTFATLDTGAHLSGALLIGDNAGTTVRVLGTVAALQTQPVPVKVTTSPDTMVAADSTLHHTKYSLTTGDTVVNSADLTTVVRHKGTTPSGVEAVIVRYAIQRAPPGDPAKGPTLLLMNGSTPSSRDTTDTGGRAARSARLRLVAATALAADTALVTATSSYRGRTLGTVTFVLIFTRQ
jgi:hypothetical protein